jgi:hypothetical protein
VTISRAWPVAALLLVGLLIGACMGGPGSTGASAPAATDSETPITVPAEPVGDPPPIGLGELTIPRPGQLDVHDISAELLEAVVDGRSVTVGITFTSGIEPCYVLDTILVERGDHAFAITLREGHGPGDMACIEIAMQKHAIVELGELEPGPYTVTDRTGGATPIEVVVG